MSALGPYLREAEDRYFHYCPACEEIHAIGKTWAFDGNLDAPTFAPSVRVTSYEKHTVSAVCHYFLRCGRIEFCADSTHGFAGKVVALPPFPEALLRLLPEGV